MTFAEYIIYLFNFGIAIGGFLAFVIIAYGGFKVVSSAGNPSALSQAKSTIFRALLGLAVLLVSYILLTTINPDLVIIKNINLSSVVNNPIFTPGQQTTTKPTKGFQEIPLGTIVENILTGTSSTTNALECYEYDINGNIADKNGDGKIDSKDIVLGRDNFYCMKNLEETLKRQAQTRLVSLIENLDTLMKSCGCSRTYYGYNPAGYFTQSGPPCNCISCGSYCRTCGAAHVGCPGVIGNDLISVGQYAYDPCPNRKQIDCKREEIKQMMDGTDPEPICYEKGWISSSAPKYPNILTFKDGVQRLTAYQNYFTSQVAALKQAETNAKTPTGERLTMAEFHKAQNEDKTNVIGSIPFGSYDTSRYCSEFNCTKKDAKGVCTAYDLSADKNMCKSYSSYLYSGDPATFYFNDVYNKEQESYKIVDTTGATCSVFDKDYGGVIPIGEAVDGTEAFGTEVAKRIGNLLAEINGVQNLGVAIAELPESCNAGNCAFRQSNCCYNGGCGSGDGCYCPAVTYKSCNVPEAAATIPGVTRPYTGCSYPCRGDPAPEPQPEADYWVCPYGNFCGILKQLYLPGKIDDSCYEGTNDPDEALLRGNNIAKVGILQRWVIRENKLFELSSVDSLKQMNIFDPAPGEKLMDNVCPAYSPYGDRNTSDIACNDKLTTDSGVKDRFYLMQLLATSRYKMEACITGYGSPYKSNLDKTQVFNCVEGITYHVSNGLNITPDFPYPNMTAAQVQNCYPYNSPDLTKDQRTQCFYNITRYGDATNPGCQMVVQDLMDNYYCCK